MNILPPVWRPHPVNRGRASLPPRHSRSQLQRWQPSWTGGLFPSQCPGRWPSHLEPLLWLQLPGCPGSTSHSGGRKYMSCVSAGEEQDALIYWNHFGARQCCCCLFWISLNYHKRDTNERFTNCKCTSMHPVKTQKSALEWPSFSHFPLLKYICLHPSLLYCFTSLLIMRF